METMKKERGVVSVVSGNLGEYEEERSFMRGISDLCTGNQDFKTSNIKNFVMFRLDSLCCIKH